MTSFSIRIHPHFFSLLSLSTLSRTYFILFFLSLLLSLQTSMWFSQGLFKDSSLQLDNGDDEEEAIQKMKEQLAQKQSKKRKVKSEEDGEEEEEDEEENGSSFATDKTLAKFAGIFHCLFRFVSFRYLALASNVRLFVSLNFIVFLQLKTTRTTTTRKRK